MRIKINLNGAFTLLLVLDLVLALAPRMQQNQIGMISRRLHASRAEVKDKEHMITRLTVELEQRKHEILVKEALAEGCKLERLQEEQRGAHADQELGTCRFIRSNDECRKELANQKVKYSRLKVACSYAPAELDTAVRDENDPQDAEIMARESNQLEMFKEVAPAAVANAISVLAAVKNWSDVREMEKVVIALGLNNENLREQPPELASSFGTGLHTPVAVSDTNGKAPFVSRSACRSQFLC